MEIAAEIKFMIDSLPEMTFAMETASKRKSEMESTDEMKI